MDFVFQHASSVLLQLLCTVGAKAMHCHCKGVAPLLQKRCSITAKAVHCYFADFS